MSRVLPTDVVTHLNTTVDHELFHLIKFYFPTPMLMTDYVHDITYDVGSGSETFIASGRIQGTSIVNEEIELSNPSLSISMAGANSADIALPLTENYNDVRVRVWRGFYDTTGETTDANIIADPFIVWDGRIDSWQIEDNPDSGSSIVTWKVASHWADWERTGGRRCNVQDSAKVDATDEFFSFTYEQIGDVSWGRVRR